MADCSSTQRAILVAVALTAVALCLVAVPAYCCDDSDAADIPIGESEEPRSGEEEPDCWQFVGVMLAVIIVSGIIIFAMKKTNH